MTMTVSKITKIWMSLQEIQYLLSLYLDLSYSFLPILHSNIFILNHIIWSWIGMDIALNTLKTTSEAACGTNHGTTTNISLISKFKSSNPIYLKMGFLFLNTEATWHGVFKYVLKVHLIRDLNMLYCQ